jgi:hypothetical protein
MNTNDICKIFDDDGCVKLSAPLFITTDGDVKMYCFYSKTAPKRGNGCVLCYKRGIPIHNTTLCANHLHYIKVESEITEKPNMTIMLDTNHMRSATVYRKNYSTICVDMPREVRTLGIAYIPSPHIKSTYNNNVIKCQPTYAKCIINTAPDQPVELCHICGKITILYSYKHFLLRLNIIRQYDELIDDIKSVITNVLTLLYRVDYWR